MSKTAKQELVPATLTDLYKRAGKLVFASRRGPVEIEDRGKRVAVILSSEHFDMSIGVEH